MVHMTIEQIQGLLEIVYEAINTLVALCKNDELALMRHRVLQAIDACGFHKRSSEQELDCAPAWVVLPKSVEQIHEVLESASTALDALIATRRKISDAPNYDETWASHRLLQAIMSCRYFERDRRDAEVAARRAADRDSS